MPRFFLHICGGGLREIDSQGNEFASLGHAVLDARKAACEIVAEELVTNEAIEGQRFEIANENGEVVATVPFEIALRLN